MLETSRDLQLVQKALERGLLTLSQLKAALIERARDINRNILGPRSLGVILVGGGYLHEEQWIRLLQESQGAGTADPRPAPTPPPRANPTPQAPNNAFAKSTCPP
jgi:hypothetical protein